MTEDELLKEVKEELIRLQHKNRKAVECPIDRGYHNFLIEAATRVLYRHFDEGPKNKSGRPKQDREKKHGRSKKGVDVEGQHG